MVQSLFGAVFQHRVFTPSECARLIALDSPWVPARVTDGQGGSTTKGDKRASWKLIELGPEHEWIFARLAEFLTAHASYGFALRELESPAKIQRYEPGDYHGWHVDLAGPNCERRKLGISVQLSASHDYGGGELCIYDPPEHLPVSRQQGCAIAFPSYVPHTVTPVTRGIRYALTAWAVGPPFR